MLKMTITIKTNKFIINSFILPIQQCEFNISTIIEQLQKDPWPVKTENRPLRCTGVALSVAIGLLEVIYFNYCIILKTVINILKNYCLYIN